MEDKDNTPNQDILNLKKLLAELDITIQNISSIRSDMERLNESNERTDKPWYKLSDEGFNKTELDLSNERLDKTWLKLQSLKADIEHKERQWWRKFIKVENVSLLLLVYIAYKLHK